MRSWARNGNIELMANVNSGSREIDETDKILKERAAQQRRGVSWPIDNPPGMVKNLKLSKRR
jgi:hypothetical protein